MIITTPTKSTLAPGTSKTTRRLSKDLILDLLKGYEYGNYRDNGSICR